MPARRDFEKLTATAVARRSECSDIGAHSGRFWGRPRYRERPGSAAMAIVSDRAGIDPAQIAQIGRERLEGIRVGVGRPKQTNSGPWGCGGGSGRP